MKKLLMSFALIALPAIASADTYKCETTNFGRGGWVPPVLLLAFEPGSDTAYAFDGFIKEVYDEPIAVKMKKRSASSYQFNWRVKGYKASNGGRGTNSYRVVLFTDRNRFTLSGQRIGYDNVISGEGKCQKLR